MVNFRPEEVALLAASRWTRISVGAESGRPSILRYIRKPHTVEMLLEANRYWGQYPIHIFYSWLAGLPGETLADIRLTIAAMLRVLKENPHARLSPLYNFSPFPGTALWEEAITYHGLIPPTLLEDWSAYSWGRINVPYLKKEIRCVLNNLYWPSLCLDNKFDDYGVPSWLSKGVQWYRPLARWRMKHLWFHLPLEKVIARQVEKILLRKKGQTPAPWTL